MTYVLKAIKICLKPGVGLKDFDYDSFVKKAKGRPCLGRGVLDGLAYFYLESERDIDPGVIAQYPQIDKVQTDYESTMA